jgi:hypothetical protein
MFEIDKLRQRLKNVSRNVIEYKMTITEARALVKEFDDLQVKLNSKPQPVVEEKPIVHIQILDGGSF